MNIRPKDRSLIARMAGNIAGPILDTMAHEAAKEEDPPDFTKLAAALAVVTALEILESIDAKIDDRGLGPLGEEP